MANVLPMTVQDVLDSIHVAYEQANPSDGPALTDDDGVLRLNLINKAIRRWEFDNNVRWRELEVLNAVGPTLAAGTVTYPITQTDFRELGSKIRILRPDGAYTYVNLVSPEYYRNYMNSTGLVTGFNSSNVACITGNPSTGYSINLGWVPVTNDGNTGGVMYFDYYKHAKKMAATTDIPEMSAPKFIVDYVVAELFVNDDVNLFSKFNGDALNELSNMRTANEDTTPFGSNALENQGYADSIVMGC